MEQKRFFFEKKSDEKFQKRIDYIKGNYIRFFKSQNLIVDSSYKIKPFMITNKVFASFLKKLIPQYFLFMNLKNC
ncbi:hypothetical protein AGMMS49953_00270 [Endomicrobiia bacterium]|nr:hypothetical protein AGMMS49953_00270 [Endomicrobiia bacterium]